MFRQRSLAGLVALFITIQVLPLSAQEIQRGKLKKLDLDGKLIVITSNGKDVELALSEETRVLGASGKDLAAKLKDFREGADLFFQPDERDGLTMAKALKLAAPGDGPRPADGGRPVSPEHASLKPLDDLGTDEYQGFAGGFYPNGTNERPSAHEQAGLALAEQVQPLNPDGDLNPGGKVVLLSIGMSNTSQSSQGFQAALADYDGKNPQLVFVNGAQGGMTAAAIQDPDDNGRGTQYWTEVDHRLEQGGVTRQQVQVVWIKQADAGPRNGFPAYAQQLKSELAKIVQVITDRFPNARLCYLSSRTYGGYATTGLNPEPYAYESGFAVKWLIEDQLGSNPSLNYDSTSGDVKSPWLSWGPYLWANGTSKHKADGLSYDKTDFAADGTHHSPAGSRKVGEVMLDFFRHDTTTQGWFNKP